MQQKQFLCGTIMDMPAYPPMFHIRPGVSKPLMPCHWRIQGNESVPCLVSGKDQLIFPLKDVKNKVLAIPYVANQEPGIMAAAHSFTSVLSGIEERKVATFSFRFP